MRKPSKILIFYIIIIVFLEFIDSICQKVKKNGRDIYIALKD